MHCTVKAGKYCIFSPSEAGKLRIEGGPLVGQKRSRKKHRENPSQKMLRADKRVGGDCCARDQWCQAKRVQDIVVRLRSMKTTVSAGRSPRRSSPPAILAGGPSRALLPAGFASPLAFARVDLL